MNRSPSLAARRIRQTLSFANGPRLLLDLLLSRSPWGRDRLLFRTKSGLSVACPNVPGARVPVYEVFAEDAYRLNEIILGLPADPIALDIGAQVGCFSIALARQAPNVKLHAYEASPSTSIWLNTNLERNDLASQVQAHAIAVSDHDGTLRLVDNGQASGLNGLTAPGGSSVTVPCVSFAAAVRDAGGRVDLVKIDTEGAEYDIVLGSDPDDWATVTQVVMEYHQVPGHGWAELAAHFAKAGLREVRHEEVTEHHGTVWLRR